MSLLKFKREQNFNQGAKRQVLGFIWWGSHWMSIAAQATLKNISQALQNTHCWNYCWYMTGSGERNNYHGPGNAFFNEQCNYLGIFFINMNTWATPPEPLIYFHWERGVDLGTELPPGIHRAPSFEKIWLFLVCLFFSSWLWASNHHRNPS